VAPVPGFLRALRTACDTVGALLVFDEVITGFRLGEGGATATLGVVPDLWCFGKVIGGGLPLAAFGGRAELMAALAPNGPVYQAGTLSGNPLATAAGHAVLSTVTPDDYEELATKAARLAIGLQSAITGGGLAASVSVFGPLVGLLVGAPGGGLHRPTDYAGVRAIVEAGTYSRLFHAMLERGVALAPGPYEVLFPGLSHDDRVLDLVIDVAGEAAADVAANT
jgi:glutamate-1-semialdehyde 2,1-aminomutase